MRDRPQSYANHRRIIPLYHFGIFGVLVVNLLWSAVRAYRVPGFGTVFGVFLALALLGLFFYARIFALAVQDRVIRLEMRLRLRDALPADLRPRIPELTRDQFIALRYASDEELPGLVRDVLANDVRDREVIKRRIQTWQRDDLRC